MKKILKLVVPIIKALPFFGDVKENLDSEDKGKGRLDWRKLIYQILRLGATVGGTLLAS